MDRRSALKWIIAAGSVVPSMESLSWDAASLPPAAAAQGYGSDPNLMKIYKRGDLWPLILTPLQRQMAAALCDVVIPEDALSPSASAVGVVEFLDEWLSAPYPRQSSDRTKILDGLEWLDSESRRRFKTPFVDLDERQRSGICEDISYVKTAQPAFIEPAKFFARFRDLTAAGFYSSPQGTRDLAYIGNVPLARFDGPPLEVLKMVGLA